MTKHRRHSISILVLISLLTVPATTVAVHGGDDCDGTIDMAECIAHDVVWCVDQTSEIVGDTLGDEAERVYKRVKCKLHSRPPIQIEGDVDPATKEQHGITDGTGTASDPFVIENWDIAGSIDPAGTGEVPAWKTTHDNGILIKNNDQHFVIRDVFVHGMDAGIRLVNSDHTTIKNSLIRENRLGIRVGHHSTEAVIVNNDVDAGQAAVSARPSSNRIDIRSNTLDAPDGRSLAIGPGWSTWDDGLRDVDVEDNRLRDDAVVNGEWPFVKGNYFRGASLRMESPHAGVRGNTFFDVPEKALFVEGGGYITNNELDFVDHDVGIHAKLKNPNDPIVVRGNDLDDAGGIRMRTAEKIDVTVDDNRVEDASGIGIQVDIDRWSSGENVIVDDNVLRDVQDGIHINIDDHSRQNDGPVDVMGNQVFSDGFGIRIRGGNGDGIGAREDIDIDVWGNKVYAYAFDHDPVLGEQTDGVIDIYHSYTASVLSNDIHCEDGNVGIYIDAVLSSDVSNNDNFGPPFCDPFVVR